MPQTITHVKREHIELSDDEINLIINHYLNELKDGRWTDKGKLREEGYTSHRFDMDCDDQSDYELVSTIEKLQRILKERKKK